MDHNGPTNRKLRLHFPLVNVKGSKMRVGDETRYPEEGKCLIFDDSFNHEAWHEGEATRIILILDLWHPELSDQEVKFFSML
jgi:aspartate beta-hydroxylase